MLPSIVRATMASNKFVITGPERGSQAPHPTAEPHQLISPYTPTKEMAPVIGLVAALCLLFIAASDAWLGYNNSPRRATRASALYMGRAAAVRAATKARTDGAKAKNNNRFAKKIIMVVKATGSGDLEKNPGLAKVVADAKAANVPMDVIKRNIAKAIDTNTADYKESLFEFVGPGGVGLLVNVLTDNDNRAANDVNLVGKKNLLKAASKGSVMFNFDRKARLDVWSVLDEDKVMEMCLEAGVDDYDLRTEVTGNPLNPPEEGRSVIFVTMNDMAAMREQLTKAGLRLETSIAACPKAGCKVLSDEHFEANMAAVEAFEALDDVDSVEHDIDLEGGDE